MAEGQSHRRCERPLATALLPIWTVATDQKLRTLLDELLDKVVVHPDHLEVHVHGVPRLNVALAEVGLEPREQIDGVGGGKRRISPTKRLARW